MQRRSGAAAAIGFVLFISTARIEAGEASVIHDARTPIGYGVELEPHLVLGAGPPGPGTGSGVGLGVRASFVVAPRGFISGVNDSVAFGLGLDLGHYTDARRAADGRDRCLNFEPGPNGTLICTEVSGSTYNYLFVPVVMQWNLWLTPDWSVFGEPGLAFYHLGDHGFSVSPALSFGARFQITDRITLTARLGYPTATFGVSFMR